MASLVQGAWYLITGWLGEQTGVSHLLSGRIEL